MTIPKNLLKDPWTVLLGGDEITFTETERSNNTHLYFAYNHSSHSVHIIGSWAAAGLEELPWLWIGVTAAAILFAAVVLFWRRSARSTRESTYEVN